MTSQALKIDVQKILEINLEILKLLDWYMAQIRYYKKVIRRLRARLNEPKR